MRKPADDRLSTADMAAAAGTAEAERTRITRSDPDREDVRAAARVEARADSREVMPPLFSDEETTQLRTRWEQVQTAFVDEPRDSVQRADELVAEVMRRLAEVFSDEREQLERQWTRGDDVSTEDLRVALRRYRSFFDRLLSV